jgi:AcrR family transcriptional regulator
MGAGAPGLRERKKAKTRAALRDAAVRLFREHGPASVTVDNICEAAEVSRRTFFNYFESKEEALFAWDRHLTDELLAEFADRPAGEPALAALRSALHSTLPSLGADSDWRARSRLLAEYPELRLNATHGTFRNEGRLAEGIAARLGRPVGTLYPQLLAGAVMAALRAAFCTWKPESGLTGLRGLVDEAFDQLAAGLSSPSA